jgi:hypothetical protein
VVHGTFDLTLPSVGLARYVAFKLDVFIVYIPQLAILSDHNHLSHCLLCHRRH